MRRAGLCVPGDGVCRSESVWAVGQLCMSLAETELMSPGSAAAALPECIPVHPEGKAGPDGGSPAPYEVGRQSLWG